MNEWWLISLLGACAIAAGIVLIYPLRHYRLLCAILLPIFLVVSGTGYYYWGGFAGWQPFIQQEKSKELARQMLKSIKTPQELIDKLKAKLDGNPQSAKGWYLLGRLYSSQNDSQQALTAFARAYHFKPDDEQFAVNYAHGLWLSNKQRFNSQIIKIFNTLLKNNPNQPDALAMLAMNAYIDHAYGESINYWQRLLALTQEQSKEALVIRKAIAKAQAQLNSKEGINNE